MRYGAGLPQAINASAGVDTSTWVVLASDGSSIPFNLTSAQVLATNPTVRTPQGDFAYSELPTMFGYAAAPMGDGVPMIPGWVPGSAALNQLPGWAYALGATAFVLFLAHSFTRGGGLMGRRHRRRRR